MLSNSGRSTSSNGDVFEPPPIPRTRGPLLYEGVRLAGGPPRRTPTRCCSRLAGRAWHAASNTVPVSESVRRGSSVMITPRNQQASPHASAHSSVRAAACEEEDDDEMDVVPSTAPLPTPYPTALGTALGQPDSVSQELLFDDVDAESSRGLSPGMDATPHSRERNGVHGISEASEVSPEGTAREDHHEPTEMADAPCDKSLPKGNEISAVNSQPSGTTRVPHFLPTPCVFCIDLCMLQQEVNACARPVEAMADAGHKSRHLRASENALLAAVRDLETLVAEEASV
ncbi:unnamed protein product, partial [Trypanosoma congolense IL3000]